jgi:DNA-nicking Smr family endonuclease
VRKPDGKPASRRSVGLSAEDAALFSAAMKDVATIRGRTEPPPPLAPPSAEPSAEPPAEPIPVRKKDAVRPGAAQAPRPGPPLRALAPGASADVDSRTLDRLRRGRLRPDARVDLHGMTQTEAHRTLDAFIGRAQAAGARCVVVITGKGRISEGGGVLRNQVPHWLNSPAIRPRILAFAPAQPRDGGAGALYVLLRRGRVARLTE